MRTTAEKKSLLLYYDYQQHFNFLSDEQVGRIVRAMLEYEIDGILPEFDETIMKMTFSFIRANLDRDMQKYIDKCSKNAENGKSGGRPKKQQDERINSADSVVNENDESTFQSQSLNNDDHTEKLKKRLLQRYGDM